MKEKIIKYIPLILYVVLVGVSVIFVRFDLNVTSYNGRIDPDVCAYNIKVARYYFLTLPFATIVISAAFYWLRSRFFSNDNIRPEQLNEKVIGRRHAIVKSMLDAADTNFKQGTDLVRSAEKKLLEEIDTI